MNKHFSAGILLYKVGPHDIFMLLGKDTKYNLWSDFGGKSEYIDQGMSVNTASREFFEESMGIISDECEIRHHLRRAVRLDCVSYRNKKYYMYLLDALLLPCGDLIQLFRFQKDMLSRIESDGMVKFKEKQDIEWFSLRYVVENPNVFREVFYNSVLNHLDEIRRCVIV